MIELFKSVLDTSKYIFDRNLVSGKAGNVSARFKNPQKDVVAITPTGVSLSRVSNKNIALVNMKGESLNNCKPSSELVLHLKIYEARPDIQGIVHTHSPYATGFSFSEKKIKRMEGFGPIINPYLAEISYYNPGSTELAENVSKIIKNEDVIILKNHGVVAVGKNTQEAGALAEFVEEIAKTQFVCHQLGGKI
ncbi:MAG: class II aldolase/adducin family protein [Euryarchaeota archaeon]|nr:class II aldolase/adducin family protein [Euryarchaeota archaeon]MBU4607053.1 class II aldolase/adducin family protein [Euryarchaeota archaeon]MBV1728743.1 class II aldolase/adducin family protein [Methanobacterium sp.]MBV1754525.1 class II aldolase/adducin family protein [Methanobacterium sp.]